MYKIYFYQTNHPYGCLSNFARYPIEIDDKLWPTSEHYFQAMKFIGTEHEERIRQAQTPMEAARMGRDRSRPLRTDWEQVKDEIMYIAVKAKFEQHQDIRDILLSTGNCILVEHTVNDAYWGDGGDGSGKNMLGKILMDVRTGFEGHTEQFYLPPRLMFPDVNVSSGFWQMGRGKEYITEYQRWIDKLSDVAREEYLEYFSGFLNGKSD